MMFDMSELSGGAPEPSAATRAAAKQLLEFRTALIDAGMPESDALELVKAVLMTVISMGKDRNGG